MDVSDKGGDKFHITPDVRKGTISLFKGPDDQLMHFAWKERPSGTVVDVSTAVECHIRAPPHRFISNVGANPERTVLPLRPELSCDLLFANTRVLLQNHVFLTKTVSSQTRIGIS